MEVALFFKEARHDFVRAMSHRKGQASGRRAAPMAGVLFEACVESAEEAREAARWGADRVELCVDLAHDGCTPPAELVRRCAESLAIPVIAMVRPRPGNFVYDAAEIATMCDSMPELRAAGAAGFATGALVVGGELDLSAMERLVDAADGLPVTFHRAFDSVPDAGAALDALLRQGVRRILTSGARPTAESGIPSLRRLVNRAAGRVEIVAAGGIRAFNVERIVEETGVPAVHARWSGWRQSLATQ